MYLVIEQYREVKDELPTSYSELTDDQRKAAKEGTLLVFRFTEGRFWVLGEDWQPVVRG